MAPREAVSTTLMAFTILGAQTAPLHAIAVTVVLAALAIVLARLEQLAVVDVPVGVGPQHGTELAMGALLLAVLFRGCRMEIESRQEWTFAASIVVHCVA